MWQMVKCDEMIFCLLGLCLLFKLKVCNVQEYDGMWVFNFNYYCDKLV